jgi:hypothetical protein
LLLVAVVVVVVVVVVVGEFIAGEVLRGCE